MNFTDEKQIPSWIAHGTLIAWWWGGSFLPWDTDVDIQINANFLYVLARFNNTVLSDRYLLDVNPLIRARHPQRENIVDARLIDKETGYFIDISGLAATSMNVSWEPQTLLLCDKHKHKYFYSDLHPLVRITFEGIATWRPYKTEHCLVQEYGSQVVRDTFHKGYIYSVGDARWIKNGTLLANSSHPVHAFSNAAKVKHAVQTASNPSIFSRSPRKISPES
jgi:hypothetical protein